MYKSILYIFILLFLQSPLFSQDNSVQYVRSSLSSTAGSVESLVGGHVNVITGQFVDTQVDFILPGPEPLVFSRTFVSGDSSLCDWHFNHLLSINSYSEETEEYRGGRYSKTFWLVDDPSGGVIEYDGSTPSHMLGACNCSKSEISCRTNLNNNRLIHNSTDYTVFQGLKGLGGTYHFKSHTYPPLMTNLSLPRFTLSYVKKPNGNQFKYDYDTNNHLKLITAADSSGATPYNWINFTPAMTTAEFRKSLVWTAQAHNGLEVSYRFREERGGYYPYFQLIEVNNPTRPKQTYEHSASKLKINGEDGRFLEIKYHGGSRSGLVSELVTPGPKDTRIPIYRFFYSFTENYHSSGYTEVYDANNNKSIYYHNDNHLLDRIERLDKSGKIYLSERYTWGRKGSNQEESSKYDSNLVGKILEDGNKNILCATKIEYDDHGNVLAEKLYGTLTGTKQCTILLGKNHLPVDSADCECLTTTFQYGAGHLLCEERDSNGKGIGLAYKANTDLINTEIIYEGPNIRKRTFYEYNDFGKIVKKTVDDSIYREQERIESATELHTTLFEYDEKGLPKKISEFYRNFETGEDKLLSKIWNEYNALGKIEKQDRYDCENRKCYTLTWEYDAHGNLLKEVNALGEEIIRTYDRNDNLIYEKKEGLESTYTYDKGNRLESVMQALAGLPLTTFYDYDNCGNRTKIIDPCGHETEFSYDAFGRVIETKSPWIEDETHQLFRATTKTEYDRMGNLIKTIDAHLHETITSYNCVGKPLRIDYPDGSSECFQYKIDGVTLTQSISRNGMITTYEHDAFGRLKEKKEFSATHEELSKVSFVYNSFHLLSETDGEGYTTLYRYDGAGRQIVIEKGDHLTTFEYDALGRVFKTYQFYGPNPSDVTVSIQKYDLLDRVQEERIEDGQGRLLKKIAYDYDSCGNRTTEIKEIDGQEAITITTFDELKRPIIVKDALGHITTYSYQHNIENERGQKGLLTCETDPLKNQTIRWFDPLNRIACITRKNSQGQVTAKKEIFYDGEDNQKKTIETVFSDGVALREMITRWEYNPMNENTSLIEAIETPLKRETTFEYTCGQNDVIIKPNGIRIFQEFDGKGRLKHYSASDGSFDYRYEYDKNDQLKIVEDLKAKTQALRDYDRHGLMTHETLGNGLASTYTYDRAGRMETQHLPDESMVKYVYDAANLLEVHRSTIAGRPLYSHYYSRHDLSGNVLEKHFMQEAGQVNFRYDLLGRPMEITHKCWSQTIPADGYDAVGNLRSKSVTDIHGTTKCHFAYDDLYQLTSEEGICAHTYRYDSVNNRTQKDAQPYTINDLNQLKAETDYRYTYDDNGNLKQKTHIATQQVIDYTYDALDRLITVVDHDAKYDYGYDSFNRRLTKTYFKKEGSTWKKVWQLRYFYQGQNEIGMVDEAGRLMELRLLGKGRGAENGATIALEIGRKQYIPLHDHNGNMVCLLDGSGQIVETYRYSAFGEEQCFDCWGNPLEKSGVNNPWRFSSKRVDPETGFVYFGRRYYDPRIGRWLAPDPLGYDAGPNLYAYVMNGPLTRFDLYGLLDRDISDVDFLSTSSHEDMRNTADCLMGMGGYGLDLALGMKDLAICIGEWAYADMKCAYYHDASFLRERSEAIVRGARAFCTNVAEDWKGTFFPETMKAWRLPSEASLDDKKETWGRAAGELLTLGLSSCKIAQAEKLFKSGNFSRQSLKTLSAESKIYSGALPNGGIKFDISAYSKAGQVLDREGLTRAGRSLDKHGNRPNSPFPKACGNPIAKNNQGQYHLESILNHPERKMIKGDKGDVMFFSPDGRGAHFRSDGSFKGFLNYE